MYFKIVNPRGHYGMIYKEGINTDILPFNPSGDCEPGGIYFSKEHIFHFLEYGSEVYSVEPIGEIYENPGYPKKWKAHSVNLTYVGKFWDISTIKFLVQNGANINTRDGEAIKTAAFYGYFEIVKFLVENGATVSNSICHYSKTGQIREYLLKNINDEGY